MAQQDCNVESGLRESDSSKGQRSNLHVTIWHRGLIYGKLTVQCYLMFEGQEVSYGTKEFHLNKQKVSAESRLALAASKLSYRGKRIDALNKK